MEENEKNAKKRREELERKRINDLREELKKKDDVWKMKKLIDKNYNGLLNGNIKRINKYH